MFPRGAQEILANKWQFKVMACEAKLLRTSSSGDSPDLTLLSWPCFHDHALLVLSILHVYLDNVGEDHAEPGIIPDYCAISHPHVLYF